MPVQELPALPPMAATFARGLLPGPNRPAAVASREVLVRGVELNPVRYAQYARVCGFTLRDAVPPTWLHVLAFPLHVYLMADPATTLRLPGLVHVTNQMRLHHPVRLGDRIDLKVGIGGLRGHRRGALVDLTAQARVGGEVVWDGVSTYLARGSQVPGQTGPEARDEFEPSSPSALWRLPADLGRRYRDVSGDPNPIHTSRLAAKVFGFARPIIHGMWTHAHVLAALENRLPASYRVGVKFTKPILLPATVGFVATRTSDGWTAAVTNRDGTRPHLLATITD